jgi:hypothetical protein
VDDWLGGVWDMIGVSLGVGLAGLNDGDRRIISGSSILSPIALGL